MMTSYETGETYFSGCTRRGYWIWGWLFWRHWNRLRIRLERFDPWYRFTNWLTWGGRKALRSQPIRFWFSWFCGTGFDNDCQHCGYDGFADHDDLYQEHSGGVSYTDLGTDHWTEGTQTCARCGVSAPLGSSSL